jgi:hypothetical protein
MSDENSRYQQDTASAVSGESLIPVDPPLGPDAKSTDAGAESQHARRTAYAELTGLELMHAPWMQL